MWLKKNSDDATHRYLNMMNQWFILKQRNINLTQFLTEQKYKVIAVYGMGVYGHHLVRELRETEVKVLYAIDAKKMEPYFEIPIYQLDKLPEKVDAVINTIFYDPSVELKLKMKLHCPIVSLEYVIFESYAEGESKAKNVK